MGQNTGTYTRSGNPAAMFAEDKRYLELLAQAQRPVVDADLNDGAYSRVTQFRRIIANTIGSGSPNNGFKIAQAASTANNFKITGGDGSDEGAGWFFFAGFLCTLKSDVSYTGAFAAGMARIMPEVTSVTSSTLGDSSANWTVNEHAGKTLTPDITIPGVTFTVLSNTATVLTVTAGDLTTATGPRKFYRIELSTPGGGGRVDEVYIDAFLDEVDAFEDTNLVHADLTPPTSAFNRLALRQYVRVKEGGVKPAGHIDADGRQHYTIKIATLTRPGSQANILTVQIADNRAVAKTMPAIETDAQQGIADAATAAGAAAAAAATAATASANAASAVTTAGTANTAAAAAVVTANAAAAAVAAIKMTHGGSGTLGNITLPSAAMFGTFNYNNLTVPNGVTINVIGGHGLQFKCRGNLVVDGIVNCVGQPGGVGGAGGVCVSPPTAAPGLPGSAGSGAGAGYAGGGGGGGGTVASPPGIGGAGAAGGGRTPALDGAAGGAGGAATVAGSSYTALSSAYLWIDDLDPAATLEHRRPGAGGGGGGGGGSGTAGGTVGGIGGTGGAGGGIFDAEVLGNITIGATGQINCKGGAGSPGGAHVPGGFPADAGGGGGGGGGSLTLRYAGTLTVTGSVNVSGGAGGAGGAQGSAGNGGAGEPGNYKAVKVAP